MFSKQILFGRAARAKLQFVYNFSVIWIRNFSIRIENWLTNQVNDNDGIIAIVLGRLLGGIVARLVEQEGRHVGREHGGVYHQEEDNPVPKGLEGWVMKYCPFVDPWRCL